MIFEDCILENCKLKNGQEEQAGYYKKLLKDRELNNHKILIIKNSHLINVDIEGEYDYLEFLPKYCKNVKIGDITFKDGIIGINCLIWGGIKMGGYINKLIASLVLINDDLESIDINEIIYWKSKLEEKFNIKEEICLQKAENKKD